VSSEAIASLPKQEHKPGGLAAGGKFQMTRQTEKMTGIRSVLFSFSPLENIKVTSVESCRNVNLLGGNLVKIH
jgi:hypothetical protein